MSATLGGGRLPCHAARPYGCQVESPVQPGRHRLECPARDLCGWSRGRVGDRSDPLAYRVPRPRDLLASPVRSQAS